MLLDLCMQGTVLSLPVSPRTHRGARKARPRITGITLVAERPHDKYGSAIFIRDDLKMKSISVSAAYLVEVITAELPDVVVHSVHKPPSEQFILPPLGHRSLPQIVIGDFNSHNTIWGYDATDNNVVAVVQWAESNSLTLIHDAKLKKYFNSARWKKRDNTDLIVASYIIDNMCVKSVLNPIPALNIAPCVSL